MKTHYITKAYTSLKRESTNKLVGKLEQEDSVKLHNNIEETE